MSAMGLQSACPLVTPVLASPYRRCTTAHSCNLIISYQFDVPLVIRPLRWFFCLLGCGSFIFYLVFPFFGCFGLFMIGRVSLSVPFTKYYNYTLVVIHWTIVFFLICH
jgi:hypothetical protein